MYYVYVHTVPNGKKYIGQTKDIDERWSSGEGYAANKKFYEDILTYGWDNIKHEIIAQMPDRESAVNLETALIVLMKTENERYGYNKTNIVGNALERYSSRVLVNNVKLKKGVAEETFFEASGLPVSVCTEMIEEWIFNQLHRDICKDRLINGMSYDELSEKYGKSVRQTKYIVYNCCLKLEEHF